MKDRHQTAKVRLSKRSDARATCPNGQDPASFIFCGAVRYFFMALANQPSAGILKFNYEDVIVKRQTLTAFAVLAASVVAPAHAAPVQWTEASGGNGHWYELSASAATFSAARTAALALSHLGLNGYLATVTSGAEQAFLDASVNPSLLTAFLGGSDEETEGVWKWLDGPEAGAEVSYTRWSSFEPNNAGNEDAVLGWWIGNLWNDTSTSNSFRYVVEYSRDPGVAPIPVPAALPLLAAALGALGFAARRRKDA